MSEFSELIKNFDKVRSYMRDFYVYGFRCREEFSIKSARSYDNERRRIESYLKDYIEFKQNKSGKNVFLTIDGANVLENPLCRAFKTKTFTKNDITLHFIILDILQAGVKLTATKVCEIAAREYLNFFKNPLEMDLATVRNKLNEYLELGMICVEKEKGKLFYFTPQNRIEIEPLFNVISFFSIIHPLGLVGNFLLDRFDRKNDIFTSKHKYLLDVLDSEILLEIIIAIKNKEIVNLDIFSNKRQRHICSEVVPLKIAISTQTGRNYVTAYNIHTRRFTNIRLDSINKVNYINQKAPDFEWLLKEAEEKLESSWGIAIENSNKLYYIEMTLNIDETEQYIFNRLIREGRRGKIEKVGKTQYKYKIEIADIDEIRPWLRTFIGRIEKLESNHSDFAERFYYDIAMMKTVYQDLYMYDEVAATITYAKKPAANEMKAAVNKSYPRKTTELFSEVYSLYYKSVAKLIESSQNVPLNEAQAIRIINETAFSESFIYIIESIKGGDWQVLDKSYCTPIKNRPSMPFTILEKSWLKAIMLDKKFKLFAEKIDGLEDIEPLFTSDIFYYCDTLKEGDIFDDEQYIETFQMILTALKENRKLDIEYISGKNHFHKMTCIPKRLEFSVKEDRFRLITGNQYKNSVINLNRIKKCRLSDSFDKNELKEIKLNKQTVVFALRDERGCLERAMIQFSGYEKETEKIDDMNYIVKLTYDGNDETEILIRLLSFGQFIRVIGPDDFLQQIKERILKQKVADI